MTETAAAGVFAPIDGGKRRKKRTRKVTPDSLPTHLSERIIDLRSGGVIAVSISTNVFSLDPADRAFVCALMDRFDEYENPCVSASDTRQS